MKSPTQPVLATLLTAAAFAGAALAENTAEAEARRGAHWREDLRLLEATFSAKGETVDMRRGISTRGQKDFAKLYPSFDSAITELEGDLPRLSDSEVVLRLMKLVASAHVAHNLVQTPIGLGFFDRLPIRLNWYSDGLAVTGASAGYETLQGTRILKIGELTPEQVLTEVSPYIPHENEVWLRQQSEQFLRWRAVLQHIGSADSDGRVMLTVQKPGGDAPFRVAVMTADPRAKLVGMTEELQLKTPLARSQPGKYYWYRFLEDSGTLYIQYNKCANDPALTFSNFARDVLAAADRNTVKRVVIDLRFNGGGDSRVIGPLKTGLAERRQKTGPLYVLIGQYTFSSGTDNAVELKHGLHAVLVGEPTGGKPSSYGELKYVKLPNSKLVVQYTTKWFGSHKDSEPDALLPDLPAAQSLQDALAGRDTALQAAISAAQ